MALSLAEVITQTRNLLADNQNFVATLPGQLSPGAWSQEQFIDAVNFAVKDYLRKKKGSYQVSSVGGRDTSSIYDFVLIPSDYLGTERVYWYSSSTVPKKMLFETDRQTEEWRNPSWEAETGSDPNRWLKWDSNTIRLIPIATSSTPSNRCSIGYLQSPGLLSDVGQVFPGDIVPGNTYYIEATGTPIETNFMAMGSSSNDVGTVFVATSSGTGDSAVLQMIDRRVNDAQQEYLKYSAAYYLLMMRGDRFEVELAEKYMLTFNQLIGVA